MGDNANFYKLKTAFQHFYSSSAINHKKSLTEVPMLVSISIFTMEQKIMTVCCKLVAGGYPRDDTVIEKFIADLDTKLCM